MGAEAVIAFLRMQIKQLEYVTNSHKRSRTFESINLTSHSEDLSEKCSFRPTTLPITLIIAPAPMLNLRRTRGLR